MTTVILPSHPFTAHKLDRMFLTSRRATRCRLSPVQQARRDWAARAERTMARVLECDDTVTERRGWVAPTTSALLMIAMVALATWTAT